MSCTFLQVSLSYIFLWKKMTPQHGKRIPNPSKWFRAASRSRIAQCNSSVQTCCGTTDSWSLILFWWPISPWQFVHKKTPGILISKAGQDLSGCRNWSCRAHRSRSVWAHVVSQTPGDGLLAPVCAVGAASTQLNFTCQRGQSNTCHKH